MKAGLRAALARWLFPSARGNSLRKVADRGKVVHPDATASATGLVFPSLLRRW